MKTTRFTHQNFCGRLLVPVTVIRDDEQYDQAIQVLDELLDVVGDDKSHPLYDLLDILSTLVEAYEETHFPAPQVQGSEVLAFLMQEHQLEPSDLPGVGDPDIVREILSGKRDLNVEQIRALSEHFGLSPATFF